MQERTRGSERFSIIARENGSEKEHNIEISEKERRMFKILDKFGKIGKQLLFQFHDQYTPETFATDSKDGKFEIAPELDGIETLTTKQGEFLLSVTNQLKNDHIELMESLHGLNREDLLKQLHDDLFAQGEHQEFDSEKVSIAVVPGGIGVLVHDRAYFNQKFPDSESSLGFYKRNESYSHSVNFPGRIFVVDTTNATAAATFRHEYLHLLTDNYIEPYEISPNLPDEAIPIQKEIDTLQKRVAKLEEETAYVEYDEVLAIQQEIGGIRRQIAELQRRKREIIDESGSYLTEEAWRLFRNVRDELSACAVSGEFNTKEDTLIPRNTTWHERVNQIDHESDRKKIVAQWEKLKLVISFCIRQNIAPDDILPIFLTSQNFESMTKRLLLFTQEQVDRDNLQKLEYFS